MSPDRGWPNLQPRKALVFWAGPQDRQISGGADTMTPYPWCQQPTTRPSCAGSAAEIMMKREIIRRDKETAETFEKTVSLQRGVRRRHVRVVRDYGRHAIDDPARISRHPSC